MPLISFVVCSYNVRPYIARCLSSIFTQTATDDFEIIVVDDASTDRTTDVLSSLRDSRLRLILHTANVGAAASWTEGLCLAKGRFVARIDGDDSYRPNFLQETLPILENHAEVGLVYGNVSIINERDEVLQERPAWIHGGTDRKGSEYLTLIEHNGVPTPTIIARKEAWAEALPIPPDLAILDWWMNLRISRRWEFYYRDKILAEYRIHSSNFHKSIAPRNMEKTIKFLLDEFFRQPEQPIEKLSKRNRIYGMAYKGIGNRYFGAGMRGAAVASYLRALSWD